MKLFFRITFKICLILAIFIGCENSAGSLYNKGLDLLKEGHYDRAITNFDKAIEINPRFAEAYNNRGIAYKEKGQYDKAITNYKNAIEIDPRLAAAYGNRGSAYAKKGEYDKAISDCTKAIEINSGNAMLYFNRGVVYMEKGQHEKAIADYSKAIELNPRYTEAYNNRGVCYFYQRDYEKAWDDVNKAESLGFKVHPAFLKDLRQASGRQTDIESTRVNENKWEKECETYEECFFWCNTILSAVGKDGMNMLTVVEDKKLCICEARDW